MNELRFDGRVAVVTGGGRGLGRAYALLLAARGANVVVNDPGVGLAGDGGDEAPAADVAREITAGGGKAVANFDSVASDQGASAMVRCALATFGRVDILINNAGNFHPRLSFADTPTELFESLWRVHVLGATHVIRAAWPHMQAQHYGRIVNTGSHSGYLGAHGSIAYASAKAAVHGLTRALSLESASHGIAVNTVAPGAMTRPAAEIPGIPASFHGGAFAPALVAPTVVWLAHEECDANGESFGAIAGTTCQIRIAESVGFFHRIPTPEDIRDNFQRIRDRATFDTSGLVFGTDAVGRGVDLVDRYLAAK